MNGNIHDPRDLVIEHDHPAEIEEKAVEILTEYRGWERGKSPSGCAAGAVYISYKMNTDYQAPTQRVIAEQYGCSPVTIRNRIREFEVM